MHPTSITNKTRTPLALYQNIKQYQTDKLKSEKLYIFNILLILIKIFFLFYYNPDCSIMTSSIFLLFRFLNSFFFNRESTMEIRHIFKRKIRDGQEGPEHGLNITPT